VIPVIPEFRCPDCGPQETLLFDASVILERQYEGLWFVLKRDKNGSLVAEAQAKDASYLAEYNLRKHLAQAVEFAEEGACCVYCPQCQEPLE